jgi:flagellar biosynthesis protein FlhG
MAIVLKDQAEKLRQLVAIEKPGAALDFCSILFTGGTSGAGSTTLAVNTALALHKLGRKAALLDLASSGDLCRQLQVSPGQGLHQVINGDKETSRVVHQSPHGPLVIPACGIEENLFRIRPVQWKRLVENLRKIDPDINTLIVDASAQCARRFPALFDHSDIVVVVATPQPRAVTGAYSLIKRILVTGNQRSIKLVLNKSLGKNCLLRTGEKIRKVIKMYSGHDVKEVSQIENDTSVAESAGEGLPALLSFPESLFSRKISSLALNLFNDSPVSVRAGCLSEYFSKIVRLEVK